MPLNHKIQLVNVRGLHARAAAKFVEITQDSESSVSVSYGGRSVCGKSLMGLMMLGARHGCHVDIQIDGKDAEIILEQLRNLIENKFGEAF